MDFCYFIVDFFRKRLAYLAFFLYYGKCISTEEKYIVWRR